MSTLNVLEKTYTIPPDLTGQVKYGTGDGTAGGHAYINQAIWTTLEGTAITVRLLLPSHCGGFMVTHTAIGCGEGHHGGG